MHNVKGAETRKFTYVLISTGESSSLAFALRPPHVLELDNDKEGWDGAQAKSEQFAHYYELRAKELGCHFLDASTFIQPCDKEGIHWHADQHQKLAAKLGKLIPTLLPLS